MTTATFLVATVFLACAVEAVEALTILLAMGTTRGWSSTLYGVAGGLVVLAVLLEGLEVAFMVITMGANQGSITLAVLGATLAVVVVTASGIAVRAPLARVPENTMRFTVGVMITSFGIFWGVEGADVRWPGGDAALLGVVAYVLGVAGIAVGVLSPASPLGGCRHWPFSACSRCRCAEPSADPATGPVQGKPRRFNAD
ncbi:MAG: hypothetical protein ACRDRI_01335 [Pseudonocardiaceae bacterium]